MLKLIPQEQPDSRQGSKNQRKKHIKKSATTSRPPQKSTKKNLPKTKASIIELTGKKLIHYSMSPDTYSDQELAQIIYDMHRANLHLQRVRQKRHNKRRRK